MRAERVPEAERRNWTRERTTFLQGELAKNPRAPHSGVVGPDQGARMNVRNTNACANLAETVPDETEDDARTQYCGWDEHGERFKPVRKSVIESKNVRLEPRPHRRRSFMFGTKPWKSWRQSAGVAGTFSERRTHQW